MSQDRSNIHEGGKGLRSNDQSERSAENQEQVPRQVSEGARASDLRRGGRDGTTVLTLLCWDRTRNTVDLLKEEG